MAKGSIHEHVVMPRDVTDQSVTYDASSIEWACTAKERMIVEHLESRPRFLVGETYFRYMRPACLYDRLEIRVTVGDYTIEKGRVKLDFHFSNKASA